MRIITFGSILSIFILTSTLDAQTNFVFPFDTTDRWEYDIKSMFDSPYQSAGHTTIRFRKDTLMPNGKTYRTFADDRSPFFFLRKDSLKIFQYSGSDSSEFVRYDFSKRAGDTVQKLTQYSSIVLSADQLISVFGTLRRTMSFQGSFVDDDVVDTIGILSFTPQATDIWYQLTGAYVNGRTFGVLTSVLNKTDEITKAMFLQQNYPNPFNPSTTLSFELPFQTRVSLTIYDLMGKTIIVLLNKELKPGIHSVAWNASRYSSGVYFYILQGKGFRITKQMLLIK